MANKIETNSKNFKPRINLNHNIYFIELKIHLNEEMEKADLPLKKLVKIGNHCWPQCPPNG